MTTIKRIFTVNGKPFFPLGGQATTSSAYNDRESEPAFKAVKLLHGNTLLTDVYWENIEPEEGKFDFTMVDNLIAMAHRYELKLILLWFATWKNARMDYAPNWVKTNTQRFKRAMSPTGADLWTLSSHCHANLEADKKAFKALCKHVKTKDSVEQTVIGFQIENEPGIIGSDRDYSIEAQTAFDNPVPAKLLTAMKATGKGKVYDIWQQAGGRESGTWAELFGWPAGELMSAWSIATYIDGVAEAGKTVYDIPMYINVWMAGSSLATAGESYPSGGAVAKVLDIYKWFTPHVNFIAPDIKPFFNSRIYEAMCADYSRDDNPFFLPETPVSHNLFTAIADYNLIGYSRMEALEAIIAEDGSVRPLAQPGIDTVRCVAAVILLLLKYQGTGNIHAIVQEDDVGVQLLDLDGYLGSAVFDEGPRGHISKDWQHRDPLLEGPRQAHLGFDRARGLVIQTSKNEFYLVGAKYRLFLRPKIAPDKIFNSSIVARWQSSLTHQLSVDEGHFDQNDEFVVDRRRNGDAITGGAWVEPYSGVVRLIMCDRQ
jgi:hypothetical protein